MSKKVFSKFTLIGLSLLLILIAGSYASAQAPLGTTAATGTAFTYQGYLEDGSGAVTHTCDFTFSLYDALTGGTQIGTTQTENSVSVVDGKFNATLDFGTGAFQGDARYMGISVNCGSGVQALSPRVSLTAAPYALSLKPKAVINGDEASNPILRVVNIDTTGSGAGLYGEARSSYGAGISGWNVGNDGGYAIYGNNSAHTGTPYGVYGIASDPGSATSYGVYGLSNSSVGTGVKGIAPMNGVYGESTATSGNGWGVYGKTNSPNGYGVYSNGNAHIDGNLTWKTMTSTVSLPGSAFVPQYSTYTYHYEGIGNGVTPDDASSPNFFAPIQLPHRATITKFTFYWTDSSNEDGYAQLYRTNMQGAEELMATASTSGGSSGGSAGSTVTASSDSDINLGTDVINNSSYNYYIYISLPMDTNGETIIAHGVTLEYTITQPY